MDGKALRKSALVMSAIPLLGSLSIVPYHLRKRGILSEGMDKIVNHLGVGAVNATWISAPLTKQPQLGGRWKPAARLVGFPLLLLGAWLGWSSTRERRIIGLAVPEHLARDGAYKYMRHPTYAAGVFASLGWSLIAGSPYSAVVAASVIACSGTLSARWEERDQLIPAFGTEYEEYREKTPMLFTPALGLLAFVAYSFALLCVRKAT